MCRTHGTNAESRDENLNHSLTMPRLQSGQDQRAGETQPAANTQNASSRKTSLGTDDIHPNPPNPQPSFPNVHSAQLSRGKHHQEILACARRLIGPRETWVFPGSEEDAEEQTMVLTRQDQARPRKTLTDS